MIYSDGQVFITNSSMNTTPTNPNTPENRSAKKKHQSFPKTDIGTPKVPVRKRNQTKPAQELLSDWENAS